MCIYIYVCVCVCVCVYEWVLLEWKSKKHKNVKT